MRFQDTWRPNTSLAMLQARARLLMQIRTFFVAAGVLEVETPVCSAYATTDPNIDSLCSNFVGPGYPQGLSLYLHTSPEFPMKRLLAAGCGPIYQICKVYRNGERGRLHSPEFSLLEWYRPGYDYHQLMTEVATIVELAAGRVILQQRLSYAELFQKYLNLNPHNSDIQTLRAKAVAIGIPEACKLEMSGYDAWLDLLLTHGIEPQLPKDRLLFVYDYPATQAALAQIRTNTAGPPVAERFELYLGGMEIANGFQELRDTTEQQQRFAADLALRHMQQQVLLPMDQHLLAALAAGLPACSGVALGIDRLLMWLTGVEHIEQVLAFPLARA